MLAACQSIGRICNNHADVNVVGAVLAKILCMALNLGCRDCAECVIPVFLREVRCSLMQLHLLKNNVESRVGE